VVERTGTAFQQAPPAELAVRTSHLATGQRCVDLLPYNGFLWLARDEDQSQF